MSSVKNMKGRKYGRWLVLERHGSGLPVTWDCRCECGTEKVVNGANLRSGRTKSCGCYRIDKAKTPRNERAGLDPSSYKTSAVFVEVDGESRTLKEWASVTGIPLSVLQRRKRDGWDGKKLIGDRPLRCECNLSTCRTCYIREYNRKKRRRSNAQ